VVARDPAEQRQEHQAEQHGEEHRIDVERLEIAGAMIPDPLAIRPADRQVLQVMGNVTAG
jgi:hypothetical protein